MNKSYFFCYNKAVSDYLTSHGIQLITIAREPKSNKLYSLYERTPKLNSLLDTYTSNSQISK